MLNKNILLWVILNMISEIDNPISYNILGSSSICVQNIPWDFPCIKKVIGPFCYS